MLKGPLFSKKKSWCKLQKPTNINKINYACRAELKGHLVHIYLEESVCVYREGG